MPRKKRPVNNTALRFGEYVSLHANDEAYLSYPTVAKTVAKAKAARKPAEKTPARSEDEAAFDKAVAKLTKLKFASKEELLALYKAGIARGKALAKK